MSKFERLVLVTPAYDKRDKGHGIRACSIDFVLKGSLGAVRFRIGTNWYVPSARRHLDEYPVIEYDLKRKPEGFDVGYHSPEPMYRGQSPTSHDCEFVKGGVCYYDGSSIRADDWVEDFVAGGTDWLWPKLEEEYNRLFKKKKKKEKEKKK